jgi:hypothetical protein
VVLIYSSINKTLLRDVCWQIALNACYMGLSTWPLYCKVSLSFHLFKGLVIFGFSMTSAFYVMPRELGGEGLILDFGIK